MYGLTAMATRGDLAMVRDTRGLAIDGNDRRNVLFHNHSRYTYTCRHTLEAIFPVP